jgi:peptide/nickel transport system substrate-binding protein
MRIHGRVRFLTVVGVIGATLLAACSSSNPTAANQPQNRVSGGTATVALTPGEQFNYIFPLLDVANDTGANVTDSEYLMWRPLYWFGGPGSVGVDYRYSLANPAQITASRNQTVATIELKPYRWSDGKPLTTRDVQFWFNELVAEKANWWGYSPGEFPDNVSAFKILSPTRFSITFDHRYSSTWLYNQLGQLIPIPQHVWDKESVSGPVGNYDLTASGAKAVYGFLAAQNQDLAAFATNPLWQVVDGPFRLSRYEASTGDATYVRNARYSGPASGSISTLKVDSFASDTAEFDALLSGSGIDYGYVPFNDAAQTSRVIADGYKVQAWPAWGITYIPLNFASPQTGPVIKQLYVREAMQRLINQASYIDSFLQGYGNPTYGPVPLVPSSKYVSPAEKLNPYPYDPALAVSLLRDHGWRIVPGGADVCERPGPGGSECGPGVASGAKLSFSLLFTTGTQGVSEEVAALQSSFSQAGIQLSSNGQSFDQVVGQYVPCNKPGCWQMIYYGQGWFFNPGYNDPDGSALFETGGGVNGGSYTNTTADSLMTGLASGGFSALYDYQNYLARQLPVLWMPQFDQQISAVNSKLQGIFPQDPDTNIYPENWYFVK